jgi:hypothetical protein
VRSKTDPVLRPISFAVKRILSILLNLHVPAYQLQGKSRWGEDTINTILLGAGRGMLPYILDVIYADKPTKKRLGKIFIGEAKSYSILNSQKADLVFIGLDEIFSRFLSRRGFMVMPEWVMFKLDTTKSLPTGRKGRGLRDNLRKAMKYGYHSEMTRDPTKFEYFFYHMYLPYADKKYGELSLVGGFQSLWKIFEKGGLLLVNRENESLAGYLLEMKDKIVSARYVGVKDGNVHYVEEGALLICYYYTIAWAKENGYEWVDFGYCRPFFNDGPFIHKKRWGMEIMKSNRLTLDSKAIFGIKVCNYKQDVLDFFMNNPFIALDEGKLKGHLFSQQDHPLTLEEAQALLKNYYIPGLDTLVITSVKGFTRSAEEFASSQSPQRLFLSGMDLNVFHNIS